MNVSIECVIHILLTEIVFYVVIKRRKSSSLILIFHVPFESYLMNIKHCSK